MSRQEQQISVFAAELAAARQHAGHTQDGLAALIHFSASTIAMIEAGHRPPSLDFARALDRHFRTPVSDGKGTFERLHHVVRSMPLPSWFRPYVEVEETAAQLRSWQPMVLYGLLQTEDYARAVLATRPGVTDETLEALVAARLDRQAILSRDNPPRLWVVMDEAVLQRRAGDRKAMHDQLLHLADMADRPNISIGIVPLASGVHGGLLGAFDVAETSEGARVGYLDTASEGYVVESNSGLAQLMLTFDTLRSEALPRGASKDMIMKWADHYGRPD